MAARRSPKLRHHQPGHADSTPEMIVTFRKKVQQRIGIPSEAVTGCSHTHSGPGDGVRDGCRGFRRAYRPAFNPWLLDRVFAMEEARSKLRPVSIATTTSQAKDMCRNRLVTPKDKSMNAFIPCFSNLKTKSLPPWGFFQPTPPLSAPPPKPIAGIMPVIGLKGWKKPLAVSPCFWPEEWVATQQRREKRSMRVPWPTGSSWQRSPCSIWTVPLLHPGSLGIKLKRLSISPHPIFGSWASGDSVLVGPLADPNGCIGSQRLRWVPCSCSELHVISAENWPPAAELMAQRRTEIVVPV